MFNATFFSKTTRCHPLGDDVVYLPDLACNADLFRVRGDRTWLKDILPMPPSETEGWDGFALVALRGVFNSYSQTHGKEPEWVKFLGRDQQRYFRGSYALEEADLLYAVPGVPNTGIGYFVNDGGFTRAICDVFPLQRLQNIGQLGRLHDPVVTGGEQPTAYGLLFDHNRLVHSLDVRAIALLMATNIGLDVQATRTLEIAALTHDTLTPAYGDGTKAIDPVYFDEDANYSTLLTGERWHRVRDVYRINEEALVATVEGKGLLGSLLDIADKLSYLSRDVQAYIGRYRPDGPIAYPEGYHKVRRIAECRTNIFGLWGKVQGANGRIVIEDGGWLRDVLRLRALMFQNLYHHPGARYLERMTGIVLIRHLIEKGEISKKDLLVLDDKQLDRLLVTRFGSEVVPLIVGSYGMQPRVEVYATFAEAERREQELLRGGTPVTFIDVHPRAKSGTHFLVRKGRSILPFADAYPGEAAKIEAILDTTPTVKLYYVATTYEALPAPLREVADVLRKKIKRPD